jgi:two-component system KDP operon response regulator KdpE
MIRNGTVLVVDDEPGIRRALRGALSNLGFIADEAGTGEQGIDLAKRHRYDAILIDINMPGIGGIETCRELRKSSPDLGILMLTVRDGEDDKVEALDAGADDYVTKPFAMRELTARLRAVQRGHMAVDVAPAFQTIIGEIALDPERRIVTKSGQPLHLTPKEFDVLEYLMRHAGMPVRHAALLHAVWGQDYGGEVEYLRTFVRQLRKKIEDDPAHPRYLTTDAFIGYRFAAK